MTAIAFLTMLAFQLPDSSAVLVQRVEIVRTDFGVPHIFAEDLKAMGFAMAYVQSEDYGDVVAVGLIKRRGTYARYVGHDSIQGDFTARVIHARAADTFDQLDARARDVYEGFAQGLNHYIRLHPDVFPDWMEPDFTAIDAHAMDVQTWSRGDAAAFVRREERRPAENDPDSAFELDGSNAWALDGSRTASGKAILLRNPHLSWSAGYYEAHVRVPGVIDFYGDFRIGGAFGIIGGFNEHLGWATTNNSPRYSQVYEFAWHPTRPNHALLDGAPLALEERSVTVDYRTESGGIDVEVHKTLWTPFGPVIHAGEESVFVLKDPRDGEFRRGEQFLRMMLTTSLEDWLDVMRMRAHPSSNFTYADADGNIALYYNARLPALPHEATGDTAAFAESANDIWSELVPWDELPLYVNPPGGYVQQANDTPDYINLNVELDRDTVAPNLPEPRLRLRSQLSLDLLHGDRVMTLEEVVELKHSPRMLMAERVLDDLLAAVDVTAPEADLSEGTAVLGSWDRTAAASSRGGVLFKRWASEYGRVADSAFYRVAWDPEKPAQTPSGIGAPGRAVTALRFAIEDMKAVGLPLDIRWGAVHRVIRGDVDEPVSGCGGTLGCFRTLSFAETEDGRLAANRGDGWVLVVEFGDTPRGYSILSYGQSRLEDSLHFDDQAAMFSRGEMKPIAWTSEDIARTTLRRYRPGEGTRH